MVTRKSKPVVHVALLRGINVGKAKRIAMSDLRALCESLGYDDVKTLLNSGNVIFSAARADANAAMKIRKAIAARMGISCSVMTLTAEELDVVIAENPLTEGETNPSRFLVSVLARDADRVRLKELARQDWGNERIGVGTHAAYLWCPDGILESPVVAAIAKQLGDAATSRNWATIAKLRVLMRGDA